MRRFFLRNFPALQVDSCYTNEIDRMHLKLLFSPNILLDLLRNI